MHWHHRVIRRKNQDGEDTFGLHEVFFEGGAVLGWSADPLAPKGESLEDLQLALRRFYRATEKPVLQEVPGPDGKDTLVPVEGEKASDSASSAPGA